MTSKLTDALPSWEPNYKQSGHKQPDYKQPDQYDTEQTAQIVFFNFIDRNAVVRDAARIFGNVVKAYQKIYHRRLSAAGWADERDLPSR